MWHEVHVVCVFLIFFSNNTFVVAKKWSGMVFVLKKNRVCFVFVGSAHGVFTDVYRTEHRKQGRDVIIKKMTDERPGVQQVGSDLQNSLAFCCFCLTCQCIHCLHRWKIKMHWSFIHCLWQRNGTETLHKTLAFYDSRAMELCIPLRILFHTLMSKHLIFVPCCHLY